MSRTYNAIIAASDTATDLKLAATAVCDGTADDVEINAALTAAGAASTPYSILLLPGTYNLAAPVDFAPLHTHGVTSRLLFDASAAVLSASATLASLVNIAPGTGNQLQGCLDIQIGSVNGNSHTITSACIFMNRASDNRLWVGTVSGATGSGFYCDQTGITDFGCFNNDITIVRMSDLTATAFQADGSSGSAYGFQGNFVTIGQIITCGNGIVMGAVTNANAQYNSFSVGPVEHNTGYGIYDRSGANLWWIRNTNSNGTGGIGAPASVTTRSTIFTNSDDTLDANVTGQFYVLNKGHVVGQT